MCKRKYSGQAEVQIKQLLAFVVRIYVIYDVILLKQRSYKPLAPWQIAFTMNVALIVIFLFTCEGVFRPMHSCYNQLPLLVVFVSACFIGNQENSQPPCQHNGNSSDVKNVRDIITRPLQTRLHLSPNDHKYNLIFENGNLPIH